MINKLKTKGKFLFIVYQAIFLFFFLIIMLCKLKKSQYIIVEEKNYNIFQYASIYYSNSYIPPLLLGLVIFYLISVFLGIITLALILKKKYKLMYALTILNMIISFYLIGINMAYHIINGFCIFLASILVILGILCFLLVIYYDKILNEVISMEDKKLSNNKKIEILLQGISVFITLLVFFIPIVRVNDDNLIISSCFFVKENKIMLYSLFIIMFILFLINLLNTLSANMFIFSDKKKYFPKSKNAIYGSLILTIVFFFIGYGITFYNNVKKINTSTVSFIPLLLMIIVVVINSFVLGASKSIPDYNDKDEKKSYYRVGELLFIVILTAITFSSLLFNIIDIEMNYVGNKTTILLKGKDFIINYKDLNGSYLVVSFIFFCVLAISASMFIYTLVCFLAKFDDYDRVVKITAYINVLLCFLIGIFGVYYKITQKINDQSINDLIESLGKKYGVIVSGSYTTTVKSQSIFVFIMSFVVIIIMTIVGAIHNQNKIFGLVEAMPNNEENEVQDKEDEAVTNIVEDVDPTKPLEVVADFDACPALTEIDNNKPKYDADLLRRQNELYLNPTLPDFVEFIVNYAKNSRLHLSYSKEDIATFVAGLGASRLAILQGMSGTGKTSLPKIFMEAIMGNCEIVEVESSWRDKNELLGYYNEFSKTYTPKKFTQCLYKAALNKDVPTFIVLDEMNLSRIEYYFSDFLSLMENEEDQRKIKLLNVGLFSTVDGQKKEYLALENGHTLKIPKNVWFIGTANKDESTFEISDKVYDRAQTMNFNKRAPKIHNYSEPMSPRFINYDTLATLLSEAKNGDFDADGNQIISSVEQLLSKYNLSFGNRVLKQIEDFVNIYCACFSNKDVLNSAIEKIMLSKVVSKLEYKNVDDKEELATSFDEIGLYMCSAFIRKLNED